MKKSLAGARGGVRNLLCGIWIACLAVGGAGVSPSPASAQEPSQRQKVERGDIIRVDVAGRQDLSGLYTVDSNGSINLPVIGAVSAAGRTINELAADLSRRFSLIDRDILRVTASLAEYKTGKIYVLGGVVRPGGYTFTEMPNVWDAIAEAGGTTPDANMSAVEVIPGDAKSGRASKIVDVASAVQAGRQDKLERLRPGDTIRVPKGVVGVIPDSNVVYIFGAVVIPGAHPFAPDLVTAVVRAGGPSPDANLKKVEIVRRSGLGILSLKIDMRSYLGNADASGNPLLQSGDTIYLPRMRATSRFVSILTTLAPLVTVVTSIVILARR